MKNYLENMDKICLKMLNAFDFTDFFGKIHLL
jgi:hypothetical protein